MRAMGRMTDREHHTMLSKLCEVMHCNLLLHPACLHDSQEITWATSPR
jgi:hypothetical protein